MEGCRTCKALNNHGEGKAGKTSGREGQGQGNEEQSGVHARWRVPERVAERVPRRRRVCGRVSGGAAMQGVQEGAQGV